MSLSKDAAIEIIDGQLDNFRGALFSFSSADVLWLEDVEEFMHAKRAGFPSLRTWPSCQYLPSASSSEMRRPSVSKRLGLVK
jgi:hypothetical protein